MSWLSKTIRRNKNTIAKIASIGFAPATGGASLAVGGGGFFSSLTGSLGSIGSIFGGGKSKVDTKPAPQSNNANVTAQATGGPTANIVAGIAIAGLLVGAFIFFRKR